MMKLILTLLMFLLLQPSSVFALANIYQAEIAQASSTYGVPEALITAVITTGIQLQSQCRITRGSGWT